MKPVNLTDVQIRRVVVLTGNLIFLAVGVLTLGRIGYFWGPLLALTVALVASFTVGSVLSSRQQHQKVKVDTAQERPPIK